MSLLQDIQSEDIFQGLAPFHIQSLNDYFYNQGEFKDKDWKQTVYLDSKKQTSNFRKCIVYLTTTAEAMEWGIVDFIGFSKKSQTQREVSTIKAKIAIAETAESITQGLTVLKYLPLVIGGLFLYKVLNK